jgi:Ca2+-binding RTX toxin-like protein
MPTIIDGTPGDDVLIGTSADEVINGYAGNDLLRGGAGVDSFDGGSETGDNSTTGYGDRISFYQSGATQGVVADLRTGIISNDGFGNAETMVGIESLGSDTAFVDTFYGNDNRNQLYGNRGDNLYGFGGNDDVALSSAASIVDGGSGIDLLALDSSGGWLMPDSNNDGFAEAAPSATSGWVVNLAAGTIVDGYGNTGNVTGIENVDGSALSDSIVGDALSNALKGNDGNDALVGGKGDDFLYGGNGDDVLTGSQGRDWLVIETSSGDDRISDLSRSSHDTILFDASTGVTSLSQLVFTQVGSDTLVTWGTSDSLLVEGVKPKQLSASDFQFGASFAAVSESLLLSDSHGTFGGGSVHHLLTLAPDYLF